MYEIIFSTPIRCSGFCPQCDDSYPAFAEVAKIEKTTASQPQSQLGFELLTEH